MFRIALRSFSSSVKRTASTAAPHQAAESASTQSSSSIPIFNSLLAAATGMVTVSAATTLVEQNTKNVPYSDSGERFDQSQFAGRFSKMILQCDPRLLFYSESQIRQAQAKFDKPELYSDRELWEARRLYESALNDSGEVIPRPFRMSGFVPYNGPICVAMIASPSTTALLFWSWVNQSQTALVNYYNRNSASAMTNETLIKSYAVAVGSALTVVFGLSTIVQRRFSASRARELMRYVAFPSAVVASSLNCYFIRYQELETGIPLTDENGNNVLDGATSQVAAKQAVYATTASRAMLQAPVYFLPPFLVGSVFRSVLRRHPAMTVPVTTYLLLVCFGLGLPAAIAVFPQTSTVAVSNVEERFQALRDPRTNQPYKVFYYNKGL